MSASNAQILPPKMLAMYAEKARNGEADHNIGSGWYQFYIGNQVISINGPDHPVGTVSKVTTEEMKRLRANAKPADRATVRGEK